MLPIANELDPDKGEIPRALIDKMGDMGYFGITIPEDKGGLGLGCFEYCIIAEELARGWMSVASIIARGNGFWRSVPGHWRSSAMRRSRAWPPASTWALLPCLNRTPAPIWPV